MNKINEIFDLNKMIYDQLDREIRLEFYASDNYEWITLFDINPDVEEYIDAKFDLDEAIEFLKSLIFEK